MAIIYKGVKITDVVYKGINIKKVIYKGVTVFDVTVFEKIKSWARASSGDWTGSGPTSYVYGDAEYPTPDKLPNPNNYNVGTVGRVISDFYGTSYYKVVET